VRSGRGDVPLTELQFRSAAAAKLGAGRHAAARGCVVCGWTERHAPKGARCTACHPPDHLVTDQVVIAGG